MAAQPRSLEDEPSVRRRSDARRNVARILDAATDLLAADPAASMADVAAASGLVRATVYRHFPSREDLLRAILTAALDEAADAIAAAEPERGPVPAAITRLVEAILAVGSRFRMLVEHPVRDPTAQERAWRVGEPIVAVMVRGQAEGSLRSDLSASWLAGAMATLTMEALRASGRGDLPWDDAARVASTTFLDGARTGVGQAGHSGAAPA